MKKIIRAIIPALIPAVFCGMFFLPSCPVMAQDLSGIPNLSLGLQQTAEPNTTEPITIAMVFGRLTGKMPDFNSWAQQTQDYKNASPFEQPDIEKSVALQFKTTYATLDIKTPLVIRTQVSLSPYDPVNHGFFITNFNKTTFFPVHYKGLHYALVPRDIIDKQWIPATAPTIISTIQKAAADSKSHTLPIILYLKPSFAMTEPANIGGQSYLPIAVTVGKMMLFTADNQTLLWRNFSSKEKARQGIMNLYQ